MADEPEDPILDSEEEEGGPIKGFLEHLEDLRWVFLKSFTALFIALLVCLFGAPTIISILKKPLEESGRLESLYGSKGASIAVRVGTNTVGTFRPGTAYMQGLAALNVPSNQNVTLDLYPVTHGTNHYLAFAINTNEAEFPQKAPVQLLNLTPASGFLVALQVAFYGGLVFASPFILFFIAQFVLPALKVNELRYVRKAFLLGVGLFLMGLALCYYLMLPIALRAAVWFSNQMGFGAFQWTADTYIGFVTKFMLAMGIGFELPIFLLLFVKIGLIDYSTLAKNRKLVFVIILVIAAILTPPDVVTQIAMAVPLYILFEITALIAWYWERKEKKLKAAEEAAEAAELEARRQERNRRVAEAARAKQEEKFSLQSSQTQTTETASEGSSETSTETDSETEETSDEDTDEPEDEDEDEEETGEEAEAKIDPALADMVAKEPFQPEGEPNPPYVPPLEEDPGYQPYAEALAQSSPEPAETETETQPDSQAEETPQPEKEEEERPRWTDDDRNPDIPL